MTLPAALLAASAAAVTFVLPATAHAIDLNVYTASPDGFGVTSTLVLGEEEAILIDAPFLLSDAHRVVAEIYDSGKTLTAVYVTHPHPDHYFGLSVIRQTFPEAKLLALPEIAEGVAASWDARRAFWDAAYGSNLPDDHAFPEALEGDVLTLEDETLHVFGPLQGDGANNSFVWIPSIRAVIAGDILFSGSHAPVASMTDAQRAAWIETIEQIEVLAPDIVIAGHRTEGAPNNASVLTFMKDYIRYHDEAAAEATNAEDYRALVNARFPGLGMDGLLEFGSNALYANADE